MDPKINITYIEGQAPPMITPQVIGPKHIFYKVGLKLSNGQTMQVTIATGDINRIERLVERNRMLYAARGFHIVGLTINDIRYTLNMPTEQYQDELMYCDIIDDGL